MKHDAIRADGAAQVPLADLADFLTAQLQTVYDLTDMPTCMAEAGDLIRKVRFYASLPETGRSMLGRNGIGPRIEMCIASARRTGFNWRTPEDLTELVYVTAARPAQLISRVL